MTAVYYVGIGNSDDKLSQADWAFFQRDVLEIFQDYQAKLIGVWYSAPDSMWQNACFCVVPRLDQIPEIKGHLAAVAAIHQQDAISWSEAPSTEMLGRATAG